MSKLDYATPSKPTGDKGGAGNAIVMAANVVAVVIGILLLVFIVANDNGYARMAQSLFAVVMLMVHLFVGLISFLTRPKLWPFPTASFAIGLTNVALVHFLPTHGAC